MKAMKGIKKPLVISFSGGRTSAYMAYLITHSDLCQKYRDEYEFHFLFANTGCEHPKTLEFVQNCADYFGWNIVWLEAKVIHEAKKGTRYSVTDFESASRDGEPYAEVAKKYGMPNVGIPQCTRELKLAPIRAWCRDNLGNAIIDTVVGIRADESRRINPVTAEKNKIHHPLNDLGVDKQEVLDFWEGMPFDLEIPEWLGNCTWCFKKSQSKLLKSMSDYPQGFEFPKRMEKIFPITKQGKPLTIFRGNKTVSDLEMLLKEIDAPPEQMILDGGCSESCEFVSALEG